MKKIAVLIVGMALLGPAFAVAAPIGPTNKITNTRILQATKDTTITYAGVKVFVPAGQSVLLGQSSDGSVILRGHDLDGVKVGQGTLTAQGPVVLTVQPDSQVIRVVQGKSVLVTDGNGRTAEISSGAAVSAKDIRADVGSVSPATLVTVVKEEVVVKPQKATIQTDATEDATFEVPAFVAATSTSSAATEQAVQDVETTLSPSTPGRSN